MKLTKSNEIHLKNIDTSLRRISDSLENGEKVKMLDAALGKAEEEIKRLSMELAETKNDLGKVESRAAHFEAQSNALYARNNLAEVKVLDLRKELAKKFPTSFFFEETDQVLDALKGRITK